jgi:hypothetical protein
MDDETTQMIPVKEWHKKPKRIHINANVNDAYTCSKSRVEKIPKVST